MYFLKGQPMTHEGFQADSARAAGLDEMVRKDYPCHADGARSLMNRILYRADRQRYLVFNGLAADHRTQLGELAVTHWYVASLLESRDKGRPVTEWYLEGAVRASLGLGFPLIRGGKG